jgi:hypothetical protein
MAVPDVWIRALTVLARWSYRILSLYQLKTTIKQDNDVPAINPLLRRAEP